MSEILSAAVHAPAAESVNITAIVQLAPAATEPPQVSVSAKSLALVPVKARLVILKVALPVLVRMMVCAELVTSSGWLPKARLVDERLITVALLVPVPVRLTVWGLPMALSVMVTDAVRLPLAEGVKVTLIVQLPPAASELPQVVVSGKSPGLVPVTAALVMLKARLPLFVRVTDCAGVEAPSNWLPKVRVVAERPNPAEVPVPVRFTV